MAARAWLSFAGVASALASLGPLRLVGLAALSVGKAFLQMGLMMLTNPLFLAVAALAAAAYLIYSNWDTLKLWMSDFFAWLGGKLTWLLDAAKSLGKVFAMGGEDVHVSHSAQDGGRSLPTSSIKSDRLSLIGAQTGKVQGQVNVRFDNLPQGARITQNQSGDMPLNVDAGYSNLAMGMSLIIYQM